MEACMYSWHKEYYMKSLKASALYAEKNYRYYMDRIEGWLPWFVKNFPEEHAEYVKAQDRINDLWGKNDARSMDEFKEATKKEIELTKFAVDQYMKYRFDEKKKDELRGKQEELV
jgi:hypothetical protein